MTTLTLQLWVPMAICFWFCGLITGRISVSWFDAAPLGTTFQLRSFSILYSVLGLRLLLCWTYLLVGQLREYTYPWIWFYSLKYAVRIHLPWSWWTLLFHPHHPHRPRPGGSYRPGSGQSTSWLAPLSLLLPCGPVMLAELCSTLP